MARSLYTAKRSKIRPQGKSKFSSALLLNALKGTTPSRTTAEAGYKEANRVVKGLMAIYLQNKEKEAADTERSALSKAIEDHMRSDPRNISKAYDQTIELNPGVFGGSVTGNEPQEPLEKWYGTQPPAQLEPPTIADSAYGQAINRGRAEAGLSPVDPPHLDALDRDDREIGLALSGQAAPAPQVNPEMQRATQLAEQEPRIANVGIGREGQLMKALIAANRPDLAETMLFENMRRRNAITDKTDPRILDFDVEKARRVAEAEEKAKSRYSSGAKTSPNYNSAVQLNKIDSSKSVAEWIDVLRGDPTKRKVAATNIIKNPQAVYSINRYLERKLGKKPTPKQTYKYVLDMIEGKESAPEAPAPAPGDAKAPDPDAVTLPSGRVGSRKHMIGRLRKLKTEAGTDPAKLAELQKRKQQFDEWVGQPGAADQALGAP